MKRIALLLLVTLGVASAADWPQWMGEQRDGIWREAGVRKDLSDGDAKVHWRVPVSFGYAGPSVAKGKVYVPDFVMVDDDFDGKSQSAHPRKGNERILCLDLRMERCVTQRPLITFVAATLKQQKIMSKSMNQMTWT